MNKVVFITGATRGIGKQIAITFARNGYDIAINYRKENEDLLSTIKEIEKNNVQCFPVQGDVSNFEDCERFTKQIVEKFGKIDVLVNNAGITKDTLLMRMKEEDFRNVIDVNLIGTFNVTKNVIGYMMKARFGKIINISSVVGVSGNAGQTNYAASKAGIIGFTKSLAKEVASRNINVNAVAPGFIETAMTNVLKDNIKEEIAKTIPLKRMGTTEDVANVVKFLASDESAYITGQVINVDGTDIGRNKLLIRYYFGCLIMEGMLFIPSSNIRSSLLLLMPDLKMYLLLLNYAMIAFSCISLIMLFVDHRHGFRMIHDRIAHTKVIDQAKIS